MSPLSRKDSKMAPTFEYAILRVIPDAVRGECVNVGLVVFLDDGLDVRMLPTLGKVSALDGAIDLNALLSLPERLKDWYSSNKRPTQKLASLKHLGVITVSDKASFALAAPDQYETEVTRLMKRLVVPNLTRYRSIRSHTRITQTLKKQFTRNGILGKKLDDISRFLVVQNFPIAVDENLYAEFALKNSHYHLTETADFRSETLGGKEKSRVASFVAIKFVEATRVFKTTGCKRYAIYAAKNDNEIRSQLAMLANNSDGVINVRSKSEMDAYMATIVSAASHTRSLVETH